jgi:tRNA A37 threonylcarbamoyladenosine synthetase subunit TsaC/SUA5/YrdC
LPTDTVYGLCGDEGSVRRLAELKGRDPAQPIALLFADVETAVGRFPAVARARDLLPGPFTVVVPTEDVAVGIRVPVLPADAAAAVRAVGVVLATSANLHGRPDPKRLDDVPHEIRSACAAELDGGELPGVASTVVDLTGAEPRVLREGAVPAAEALARLRR